MSTHDMRPVAAAGGSPSAEALAESSERYASMFTHHPHAAYSVDRTGRYTDANPRALAMTGLTLEQMRETHFSQVIHPEDVHLIEDGFERALAGTPQLIEARVLQADGGIVDIRCTAIPVVVGGEVVGVHGITEDVTEAKQLVRRLEEANAAKTSFLANVSHEVRTPLASVIGATELLMDAGLDPVHAHFVDVVHRSGQRLRRLVDDILDFSRLEAEQVVLRTAPFSVRGVVEEVAEWAVPLAQGRGLTLTLDVDGSVPSVAVGDGRRVTQVVTHLVDNALKFTECGGVEVSVTARDQALPQPDGSRVPGVWVEFTTTDTGIGMPQDLVPELFAPFAQADPSITRGHGGLGLGLAICRDLVDLMGGRIRATSSLGEGSAFVLGVPLGCPVSLRS